MAAARSKDDELTKNEKTAVRIIVKKSNAIWTIVNEAGQGGGIGSDSWCKKFDEAETNLSLPPITTVNWPPHARWARRKNFIQKMRDVNAWLATLSKEQLLEHGVLEANVTIEQDRCIGERLAQGLKADSYASALAELKLVFVVGGELPFEDRIQDMCAALAVAIDMESFTDLAERKDVCEQAEKMIEAAIAENTHIASSLCG